MNGKMYACLLIIIPCLFAAQIAWYDYQRNQALKHELDIALRLYKEETRRLETIVNNCRQP